ncbi:GGDEF domain-containing protein [bacterium]|nr:GGDEF domain-containing protein [bacterium]
MDNNLSSNSFDLSPEILDEIQLNIEEIIKGFPISETNKIDVIKKINFMYSHTKHLSVTDPLTGLYNRRHFDNMIEREFLRAQRYSNDLSIALIDVDFFKKVNDTHGHLCGDYVLKEVAYLTLQTFRKTDMVFRYGGEEILVILTETPLEKAVIPLERLRKSIENYPFNYDGKDIKITVSIGVESLCEETHNFEELIDHADKALYKAKDNGRNQVVTSSAL